MNDPAGRRADLALQQRALEAIRSLESDPQRVSASRIPRREAAGDAPLSFAQQRLWFLQRLEPMSPAYNMPFPCRLEGHLDGEALRQAFEAVVSRHESLRTCIIEGGDGARQVILPNRAFALPVTDLTSLPRDEREAAARGLALDQAMRPFDLARDPPLRASLLRLDERVHVLLLVLHHITSDAWSVGLLFRELAQRYEESVTGRPAGLPDLTIQYADFSVWQRERMQSAALRRELDYWKRQLDGAPPLLELPTDRPRPSSLSHVGKDALLTLPASLGSALGVLSRAEGATLFMTLLAGFQLLLSRWSGQSDIVVGAPIAGRTRIELEALIGCFVNTLVLRTGLAGNPSFRELLGRVREVALQAFSSQELPFERLVEELQPERSLNYNPLFQVLFQVNNTGRETLNLHGLEVSSFDIAGFSAKFDLTLRVQETAGALTCFCRYSEDLFSAGTIAHLLEQYQALLEQIVTAPDAAIGSYSLITPRSRLLLPEPGEPLATPIYPVVTAEVSRVAQRAPEAVAVRQGRTEWSYGQLDAAVLELGRALRSRGVTKGSVVAVTGRSSFGLIAVMLATLASGAVMLPIAENLPERRKRLMLREARATHLVQAGDGGPDAEWIRSIGSIVVVRVDGRTGQAAAAGTEEARPPATRPVDPEPDDPAYIFFTSGTTGTPKAVLGTHQGVGHFLQWQRATFEIARGDRCSHLTSLSFDVVLREVFLPLTSGATLCIPEGELPTDQVLAWLAAEEITVVHGVPSLARAWLDDASGGLSLPAVRWVFLAGEPLNDTLVRRWRAVVPAECELVNLYGPTETTMVKCCYRVPSDPSPGVQPVGRPLPQSQAMVLADGNRLCGVNEPGEIVLRTPFMTRGYLNAPDEQRRRFLPNPFGSDPADLVYRTGDRGRYRPDGDLMMLGRLDHQIKIRGVRIEPEEVAAVLSQHPDVHACAVTGRALDGAEPALVAYVVTRPGGVPGAALRAYLAERLPAAMVPAAFVPLDRLPLTANGKLDLAALPAPPVMDRPAGEDEAVSLSPMEQTVGGIWKEVLELERIGLHDDFFDLGGHSLLATRVVARMRLALGLDLPLRTLFEAPTISSLARIAERLSAEAGSAPHAVAGGGPAAARP